ncbi:MAG: hypothetical protein U0800_25555 [Isosphaeraceae bacterium]
MAAAQETKADNLHPRQRPEVTGGKSAYEKVKGRLTRAKIELPAAGVSGKITINQSGDKALILTEIEQIGTIQQGVADGVAWEVNPLTGPRVLEGDEKAGMLRSSRLDSEVNWRKYYPKAEAAGVEMVDGKPAYKLVLTPAEGNPTTQYYDQKSGLLVRSDSKQKSPMGEIPVEVYYSDYKKVDGILMPFKSVQQMFTQELVLTIDEVKNNPEIPASTFAIPAEVQKLAEKKK